MSVPVSISTEQFDLEALLKDVVFVDIFISRISNFDRMCLLKWLVLIR